MLSTLNDWSVSRVTNESSEMPFTKFDDKTMFGADIDWKVLNDLHLRFGSCLKTTSLSKASKSMSFNVC